MEMRKEKATEKLKVFLKGPDRMQFSKRKMTILSIRIPCYII